MLKYSCRVMLENRNFTGNRLQIIKRSVEVKKQDSFETNNSDESVDENDMLNSNKSVANKQTRVRNKW